MGVSELPSGPYLFCFYLGGVGWGGVGGCVCWFCLFSGVAVLEDEKRVISNYRF